MSKKKAIKIATATAIAASAFVATAPVQSEAASNSVDKAVKKAKDQIRKAYDTYQKAAKQGKLASYSAMQKEITLAKKFYNAALAEADKKGGKNRGNYRKQIFDQKKLLTYAERYAYTVNINVTSAQANLEKALNSDNADEVIAARSALNSKLYAFNKSLAQVYGTDARKVLNSKYASPAKAKLVNAAAVLAVYNAYKQIEDNLEIGKTSEAGLQIENVKADLDKLRASSSNFAKKVVAYAEKINEQYQYAISIYGSAKAVNNTTVEVTFKNGADASKLADKSKYSIEGLTIEKAVVKQDSNTVVLTTSAQEAGKDYVVKHDGKTAGTFKGAAVAGDSISIVTTETNSLVPGQAVPLAANVGKAGIEVTFVIEPEKGSTSSERIVKTAVSDANGIATVTGYTRYNAVQDTVTAYITGKPDVRAVKTFYWGSAIKGALTIEGDSQPNKLTNGTAKTYTVTLKNPVTGKAIEGAYLNVTFKENLNTDFKPQRNATVTNSDNQIVTPYQSTDGEEAEVKIKTDKDGKATFTVTGTNTTVTPIVFLDGSNQAWDTNGGKLPNPQDGRFDQGIELAAYAASVTFAVTDYKIKVEGQRTNYAAVVDNFRKYVNGREYKITVLKPDGTPYAGGNVNVGIDELLDGKLGNEPRGAFLVASDNYDVTRSQQLTLRLDSKGQAKFYLSSTNVNDSARPVVWIDQNNTNNSYDGRLEEGEPVSVRTEVLPTNFQTSRVDPGTLGAKLEVRDLTDKAREDMSEKILNVEDVKGFNLTILNQSGKPFLPPTQSWDHLDARVTFEVVNTGTHPIKVHTSKYLGNPTLKNASGADDTNIVDGTVTIEVGGRVTIAGDIRDGIWWTDINSAIIAVYSLNGNSSVEVKASAVVDGKSFDFGDNTSESQSVAVSAGPVSVNLANSSQAPKVQKVKEVDTNNDGSADQIVLTFDKAVSNFEAGDFRLVRGSGTGSQTHYTEANKVEYGKKDNDITKTDDKKLVLTFNEFDTINTNTVELRYDAGFSGNLALTDEFGNKVAAFVETSER